MSTEYQNFNRFHNDQDDDRMMVRMMIRMICRMIIRMIVRMMKLPLHQPIQISFSSGSVVPNMRLTKKLFYQGKQARLLSTKLS